MNQMNQSFSERMGFIQVRKTIQKDDLDHATRIALWNVIGPFLEQVGDRVKLFRDYWIDCYGGAYDEAGNACLESCRHLVFSSRWNRVFDFIEFLVNAKNTRKWKERLESRNASVPLLTQGAFNAVFQKQLVGYRLVDGRIVPITEEMEMQALEEALAASPDAVREQMSKAVSFWGNREHPDFAQAVQCAISAVESQCRIMLSGENVTLGEALKLLERNGHPLHPALKKGFSNLYGFTSQANGIRHGGIAPSEVDADFAKFFLVICSAFINYLQSANCLTKADVL